MFVCSEFDADDEQGLVHQKRQLKNGFRGRIRQARASVASDKTLILSEIQADGDETEVDNTIAVLLVSGMSSRDLRVAHAHGIDVKQVGVIKRKYAFAFCNVWFTEVMRNLLMDVSASAGFAWCIALPVMGTRLYSIRHQRDRLALAMIATWKLLGLPYLLVNSWKGCVLFLRKFLDNKFTLLHWLFSWHILYSVPLAYFWLWCLSAAMLTANLSLGTIASLPLCGKGLAQNLATTRITCCAPRSRCKRQGNEDAGIEIPEISLT